MIETKLFSAPVALAVVDAVTVCPATVVVTTAVAELTTVVIVVTAPPAAVLVIVVPATVAEFTVDEDEVGVELEVWTFVDAIVEVAD